jgi:hypothetical protein
LDLPRAERPFRTFQYFNLAIVNMRKHLPKVSHVKAQTSDRAPSKMIGLDFGDAISVNAMVFSNLAH